MSSDGCNIIEHYQKAIKKARNDESKLLHCIRKLDALPITIDHLQRTGVGKTVNSLRKYNGEVGDAAKILVAKWKTMVSTGEVPSSSSPEKHQNGYGSVAAAPIPVPVPAAAAVVEREYSPKNNHIEIKESEARLTSNGKHKEEKRHSESHKDSNHRIKDIQTKHTDHHHESSRSSSSKSNGKEKTHKSSSRHAEKSSSSSSKSSSSKSSSKRHREEDSASKSHKRERDTSVPNGTPEPSGSSSSKQTTDEVATEKHHSKAKKPKLIVNDGIDSTMGASFSDALGMCGIGGSSKKNKKLQKITESSKQVVETPPRSSKPAAEKESKHTTDLIPEALKTSPKTKLDISLNLPIASSVKISDNYKPSPINQNVMNCIYPSSMPEKPSSSNYNDLNIGITSKTMRTKVYSGVKTGALLSVPSLFDICIRVLQKNIDALEYTGGVPFDVLRPVLERTTPQQLLNFEDYNAYLLEDTDVLWQQHVGRHFRGKMREEGESWREMFLRCEDEKERRLNILTKNIKISQKQSALPIKKTRLAYVDNVVKPPRNVQRKQELYGTNDKLIASPAARVAALSSASHNTVVAGDPRLKIGRDLVAAANSNPLKIKKAPLMAKTLQFIKKTYKR